MPNNQVSYSLWTERYRPSKLEDYVFRDEHQKATVIQWIKDKSIPNILLSGTQGLGKTSLINVLLTEIGIEEGDILEINASEETSIDVIRNKVINFASTMSFGKFKVIILEEFEMMSGNAQSALKRVMEEYTENVRFLLTSNNPHKILPPIISRCQQFHMVSLDQEEFMIRLATILASENVEATVETLDTYVKACYPDLRKAINAMQQNSIDGKLQSPTSDSGSSSDVMIKMVDLFKAGNITAAREYICENADYNDYPEIYRFLYRNLNLFGDTVEQREDCILVIRDGIVKDSFCADREICLAGTLIQLRQIKNKR
jgi:replication factor C small subunit